MSNRATATTTPATTTQSMSTSGIPHDRIAKRAYEKWLKGGCKNGVDKQNWIEAETELRTEMTAARPAAGTPARR